MTPPLDDIVLHLYADVRPFQQAMERAAEAVRRFGEALGTTDLRPWLKWERRRQVNERRIGIELRRRDRRRARRTGGAS